MSIFDSLNKYLVEQPEGNIINQAPTKIDVFFNDINDQIKRKRIKTDISKSLNAIETDEKTNTKIEEALNKIPLFTLTGNEIKHKIKISLTKVEVDENGNIKDDYANKEIIKGFKEIPLIILTGDDITTKIKFDI